MATSDRKKVQAMQILLARAQKARSEFDKDWAENLEWLEGKQMTGIGGKRADTVTNFLFAQAMTVIPILANRVPEISAKPIIENDVLTMVGELQTELINRTLRRNDFVKRQQEMMTNGLAFGQAYLKPTWSQRMRMGLGDIKIEALDSRMVFKEPGKMRISDSNYVHEVRKVDKLTLLRMFPDKADIIDRVFKQGYRSEAPIEPIEGENTGEIGYHAAAPGEAALTTSQAYVFDSTIRSSDDKPFVDYVESWMVDDEVEEQTYKEEIEGKPVEKKRKAPKYPTGRRLCWIGDELLADKPNPFPMFPYLEYENYHVPGRNYGMSELEQLKPMQEQFNVRMNQLMDSMNFANMKMMFVDQTAGLDIDEITNEPGAIYPVADVSGIKVLDYGGPNRAQFDSLTLYQRLIEIVSGVREVTQGEVPGDVRSGFAVEQLQQAAQTRLRMKTRILEDAVRSLAKLLTDMMAQFYVPGIHYHGDVDLKYVTSDLFDYEVRAGINLPQSRLAEQQLMQWAFTQGLVHPRYLVEVFDFPNKEALIEQMTPYWEAMMQARFGVGTDQGGNVVSINPSAQGAQQ